MQKWSPWPQGRPRGHNLKSFALNTSPRKCPVLSLRTALFYDMLKTGQGHEQCCFVLEHARELAKKKKFWRLKFVEKLRICGRRPFFEIACVSQKFWAKTVYFVSWRTLPHCVFGHRPRAFPSLASDFFGVLGLEPCVLDSTFDVKLVINLANLQTC